MDAFGMPKDVATIVSAMTINAPILSARALKRHGISARRAADVWSEFIIGGNNAIAARFGRKKKLSKPKVTPSKQSRQKTFVPGSNP
jgi:hypothetical protein